MGPAAAQAHGELAMSSRSRATDWPPTKPVYRGSPYASRCDKHCRSQWATTTTTTNHQPPTITTTTTTITNVLGPWPLLGAADQPPPSPSPSLLPPPPPSPQPPPPPWLLLLSRPLTLTDLSLTDLTNQPTHLHSPLVQRPTAACGVEPARGAHVNDAGRRGSISGRWWLTEAE